MLHSAVRAPRRVLSLSCAVLLAGVGAIAGLTHRPVSAQGLTEWSSEQRVLLSYRVNEAALQRLMPPGWTVTPSTAPGNPGANLNLTFIDRLLTLDGEGKQYRQGSSRYVVLVAPARSAAGVANNIIISGMSPEGSGAYGVNLLATTSRVQRTTSVQAEDGARVDERWDFAAASGERIELQVAFRRGPVLRSRAETKLRSAVRPDFTRTYRIDQAADVLRSATAPDRIESLAIRVTGPAYAALFDGSEKLLSVTAFPYYLREISVP